MQLAPDGHDLRVDVDARHGLVAIAQRRLHVVARARADDQRRAAVRVHHERQIVQPAQLLQDVPRRFAHRHRLDPPVRQIVQVLVKVPVDLQVERQRILAEIDPVVGREQRAFHGELREAEHQDRQAHRDPRAREPQERHRPEREPDHRSRLQPRRHRERHDAEERAPQVRRVRAQHRHSREQMAQGRPAAHEHRDEHREQREKNPQAPRKNGEVVGAARAAPQDHGVIGKREPDDPELLREGQRHRHQQQAGQREVDQPGKPRAQRHAHAHPEESPDQHQVVEVGKHPHLGGRPANQRQLQREDAECRQRNQHRRPQPPILRPSAAGQHACQKFGVIRVSLQPSGNHPRKTIRDAAACDRDPDASRQGREDSNPSPLLVRIPIPTNRRQRRKQRTRKRPARELRWLSGPGRFWVRNLGVLGDLGVSIRGATSRHPATAKLRPCQSRGRIAV